MSQERVRRSTRSYCRRPVLDVDLNVVPPNENHGDEESSNQDMLQDRQVGPVPTTTMPAPIDLEALDDDVIISSPRAFAEAKNNQRRNRGRTTVVDLDSVTDERTNPNKRKRLPIPGNHMVINCDTYINMEGSSDPMRHNGQNTTMPFTYPPPPPPKEPTFSCPICMGSLVDEMSTKCGHIFCKACIKAAIAAQHKCPTCRKKVTVKELIRVYLPATKVLD